MASNVANNSGPKRDELLENLGAKLRALFPNGTDDAEEKRAEVLAFSSEQVLGGMRIHDVAAAAELPLADLEKVWRAVDGIMDAY